MRGVEKLGSSFGSIFLLLPMEEAGGSAYNATEIKILNFICKILKN